jgi:sulfoxide reductase heme-binding subunit YedZ
VIAAANAHVWWWLARASGIVAWCLATAAIVWGLTLSSKAVRRRRTPAWLLDVHKYLGTLTLAFVAVHIAAIAADSYVQFSLRDLFIPMASAWRPGAVAWGIVAFYVLVVVEVSSWLMKFISRRIWHWIHLSSFAIFAAATVHGALAGADHAQPWVQFSAVAGVTIVLFLLLVRVLNASGALDEPAGGSGARAAAARARAVAAQSAAAAAEKQPA